MSPRELEVLNAFLRAEYADGNEAFEQNRFVSATVGFPQGSSISLFFANIACLELDRDIERTGAAFARYADDTVMVCDDYQTANTLALLMMKHGETTGAAINLKKSDGLSLLARGGKTELPGKRHVTFLGHEISPLGIKISEKAISRMKRNLAKILYNHLLRHPKRQQFNPERIDKAGIDLDLVSCLAEIRNYLYGGMAEAYLQKALAGERPVRISLCSLSYFPAVTDPSPLATLDGWLLDTVQRTHDKRRAILKQIGQDLRGITKEELLDGSWCKAYPKVEAMLPSSVRGWRYVRKCYLAFGLNSFPSPPTPYSL